MVARTCRAAKSKRPLEARELEIGQVNRSWFGHGGSSPDASSDLNFRTLRFYHADRTFGNSPA